MCTTNTNIDDLLKAVEKSDPMLCPTTVKGSIV